MSLIVWLAMKQKLGVFPVFIYTATKPPEYLRTLNSKNFFDVIITNNKSVGIFMRDSLNNSFINLHISDGNQHGIFFGADQFPFYHYFHLGDA
jgi:hypothetical protein